MKLFNMELRKGLLIGFSAISIVVAGIITLIGFRTAQHALEEESFNKLTGVREMKARQVEDYFKQIRSQVVTFSEDRMVVDAMKAFKHSFEVLESEYQITNDDLKAAGEAYYREEFLPRLNKNLVKPVELSQVRPKPRVVRILQHLYISKESNPNETGSKHLLNAASDDSTYSETHKFYHPIFRRYLEEFGYYDIFLIDAKTGHIVYTVFKEVDFGTSLLTGPYKNTNFAEAYHVARNAEERQFSKLVDFEPYEPSYHAPASFISSPIFDGGKKIGVLVFQMPINRINNIMTNNHGWSDVGLGESGETYLVGEDSLLRNQSRFLIEDRLNYFKMIERIGLSRETITQIDNLNTTIGLQPVKTKGTEAALSGKAGTEIFPDYRGVKVLSSYKPLALGDVKWAIMSEIDEAEAFSYVYSLKKRTIFWFGVLVVVVIIAGVWSSKALGRAEKEILQQKTLLENTIESLPHPFYVINAADYSLEIANSAAKKLGAAGASTCHALTHKQDTPCDSADDPCPLEEVKKTKEAFVCEHTHYKDSGERFFAEVHGYPIFDEAGNVIQMIEYSLDITERKEAEAQLKLQSEALKSAANGIVITDHNGTIQWANPAAASLTGFDPDEIVGQNPHIFKSGQQDKAFYEEMWRTIRDGRIWRGELVNKRKDGSLYNEEMAITPVSDNNGEIIHFVAIKQDVTVRKEAEQKFRSVTESAIDAIITVDDRGKIQNWNQGAEKSFGYRAEEVIGQGIELIIPERFLEAHQNGMQRMAAGEAGRVIGRTIEVAAILKDGREIPIDMSLAMWTLSGKRYFTGILRDITERKKAEEELRKAYEVIESQKERMEKELNVGREIQMSMLPLIFPAFPERDDIDVHAMLKSAREVGGDFYDFFFLDENRFCFCIGDVSGKGVPAALFMAVTKTLIKSRAMDDASPASILTRVNEELSHDNKASMFVTVFLAILNVKSGELVYTNAGHNPPYVTTSSKVEGLTDFHGPVIGAVGGLTYKESVVHLGQGDSLHLFTDGVTEAMNKKRELFTDKRLEETLSEQLGNTPLEVVTGVADAVSRFEDGAEPADDFTMLSVEMLRPVQEISHTFNISVKNQLEEIPVAQGGFAKFAEAHDLPKALMRKFQTALDELLNNIISYGYQDEELHFIKITGELNESRFVMSITDDATPFNPFGKDDADIDTTSSLDERSVGGLGIHLVRNMMDDSYYRRLTGRNMVTFVKYLNKDS